MAPLDAALRQAMSALGYSVSDDCHAPGATGISRAALTLREGRRVSTNDAYLEPVRNRANLDIRGDTAVDCVIFDGNRATGVRTATGEEIAAREVFICAGAIHSPAILLRSGVGVDDGLRVGENLCEHACAPGFEIALKPHARMATPEAALVSSVLRYTSGMEGTGPNDMQMAWFGAVGATANDLTGGRLFGSVMRVFSRGRVALRSADPFVDPIVEFNLLSDERDLLRLRDCVQRMIQIAEHPAVVAVSDRVLALATPLEELSTEAAIDEWLVENVNDYVHAAGTCRMGSTDDPSAVVDTDCRVIGYEALRVCDASVMPDVPKANTHLTTVAIAERLAMRTI